MKKLYLVRHAKSSWEHDGVEDVDRPLKGRGIRDAYGTAHWLAQNGDQPELMVSSNATRALHTALIFARELDIPFNRIQIEPSIYEAGPTTLLEVIRQLPDDINSAMIFGHNPGLTTLVNKCIDHTIDNVPTTGVACLMFNCEKWREADHHAELVFFDYPKRRKRLS